MASANEYPMDFWIYPAWESEKGVLDQPMFFNMPESKNLILDYENVRGEAFSHFRRIDFGQDPIDMKLVHQGHDFKGKFQNDQYKFKPDAYETIALRWLDWNTYGTVQFGTNPYLTIKNKNCQFGGIGHSTTQNLVEMNSDIHSKHSPTFGKNPELKADVGPSAKLKIKNLDLGVTVEDLSELFSEFGPLKSIYVNKDRYWVDKSLATANLYFEKKSNAMRAMKKYNGFVLFNKPMKVYIPEPESLTPDNFEYNGKHSIDFQTHEMVEVPEIMRENPWRNVYTQPILTLLSDQLHGNRRIINPMCRNPLN